VTVQTLNGKYQLKRIPLSDRGMTIKGVRAFGKNEGALGHTGDFVLLFEPLIPYLQNAAVFGPELYIALTNAFFHEIYRGMSAEEIKNRKLTFIEEQEFTRLLKKEDELCEALEELKIAENVTGSQETVQTIYKAYYGPGFFPKYARFLQDDWNNVICFREPFPNYKELCDLFYAAKISNKELRQRYKALKFYILFQNIDACFWEAYVPDRELYQKLTDYLDKKNIEYELLDFDQDFPDSPLKNPRDFKDVHTIWP